MPPQQNSTTLKNTPVTDNVTVNNSKTGKNQDTTVSSHEAKHTVNKTKINQPLKPDLKESTSNSKNKFPSTDNKNTGNIQYASAAAGDNAYSNVQDNWFVTNNITEAAGQVQAYIEANHRLPNFVQVSNIQISMPQFLKLLTTGLIQVNKGSNAHIGLESVQKTTSSIESLKSRNIGKSEYVDLANRIQNFMDSSGKAPNYASSTLGNIRYESLIYLNHGY